MNYYYKNNERGFTLIEMLISMAIGMIIIIALSSTFLLQRDAYDDQEQIAEMVQNARAAMDMMTREIRMGGYDPTGAGFDGIPYNAGQVQIRADIDGDGNITGQENIIYIYDATNLQIDRNIGSGDQPFAENIQAFTFSYLDSSGNTTSTTSNIRQIQITITARTAEPDKNYTPNSGYRIYTLTSLITPRNLVL
jgi:type IV pilus assembly protein PilW